MNRRWLLGLLSCLLWACEGKQTPEPQPAEYSLDIPYYFGRPYQMSEGTRLTADGVLLGRMLFYEKKLSRDGTVACASCHQQDKAFTDGRAKAVGIEGRQVATSSMSLVNLVLKSRFTWAGGVTSIDSMVQRVITHPQEMDFTVQGAVAALQRDARYPSLFQKVFGSPGISGERMDKAMGQFLRTIVSSNSKYDRYLTGEYKPTDLELQGMNVFFAHPIPGVLRGGNCGDCHVGSSLAGDPLGLQAFHNNGLDGDADLKEGLAKVTGREGDWGKFQAPTLRNIALTAPYMHDGRYATLEEVVEHYDQHIERSRTLDPLILEASNEPIYPSDPVRLHLTAQEKKAILAFLQMLTDETLLTDPRFADPHR